MWRCSSCPRWCGRSNYYRGWYNATAINKPDYAVDELPTRAQAAFVEVELPHVEGTVVIDLAHDNAVQKVELNVLLARLTARGVKNLFFEQEQELTTVLHNALALIVVAPHRAYTPDEVAVVERFVKQGGRVLLVGDPGRYAWVTRYDQWGEEYQDVQSDVATINVLAAPFGLAYSDDYVYNTVKNDGHYQYVIVENFAANRLTAGLKRVVLYAAHSLAAAQEVLIGSDEHTVSSLSEQSGGLALLGLGGNGNVLALPDLTFMTEPYNSVADNNRLISNIADFLVQARRVYGLTDFPYLFDAEVRIVPLLDVHHLRALSAEEIDQLSRLKSAFEADGRGGTLWGDAPDQDVLYLGLYGNVEFWPEVAEILAGEGISFTLETVEQARATPTSAPRQPPRQPPRYVPTPTRPAGVSTPIPTPTPLTDWIHLAGGGAVEAKEVALFYQSEQGSRRVMIVLAFTDVGLREAIKRLVNRDWDGCLEQQNHRGDPARAELIFCPTAYDSDQFELTRTPEPRKTQIAPTVGPTPGPNRARLLIVSDEDGKGAYEQWTEAYAFSEYANEMGYQVTFWSTVADGEVALELLQDHDAVIWCTGDYQEGEMTPEKADVDNLVEYLSNGGRVVLSGAFIGEAETESGLLVDVQVAQSDHPLAAGFSPDQVIALERFTADRDYAAFVFDEPDEQDVVVLVRGPRSEFVGRPLSLVDQNEDGGRSLIIGVPLYLLPLEAQQQWARNILTWLTEGF